MNYDYNKIIINDINNENNIYIYITIELEVLYVDNIETSIENFWKMINPFLLRKINLLTFIFR